MSNTETPMAAETANSTMTNEAIPNDTSFTWSVPLDISAEEATYLDSSQTNDEQELMIPREVIAEVVGASRLVAELERPLKIGTYNDLPAYLLRTRFSFQRTSSSWLYRISRAEITIVVEDAQQSIGTADTIKKHPAIAAWYPKLFEGEISHAVVTESVNASLDAGYMVAGASVGVERSRSFIQKGRVVVHGVPGGGRNRNSVTWTVEQDDVEKSGIPREIRLPFIVTRQNRGRFLARVTIKAHYGFWRGALARNVPVVGKNDHPLYFDPSTLDEVEKNKEKGPDGKLIAESSGIFDDLELERYSTLREGAVGRR